MNATLCRNAPGHVVHHIPVSLLYRPWKRDVLKICTPAMQNAFFSQMWRFYARARAKVLVMLSCMWPLMVDARVPMRRLTLLLFCLFLLLHAHVACQRVFCIRSEASFRMHFINAPMPPSWLHACSCRRTASKCRFCAYNLMTFAKTMKIKNPISSCLSKATYNYAKY